MATERERMLAGELYVASDPELVLARRRARDLLRALNGSRDVEMDKRRRILGELLGAVGEGAWIEPPFSCDYGRNITLGDRVYFNFNCVILDCAAVTIGSDVFFGPNVQVYAATHPTDHVARRSGLELARPIEVGSDVWIGGGAILCPGVRVGARSVIGAGSVVTRDVPEGVVAAGNPCRVIRSL
jgi:maltose O-acetyltransferase